MLGFKKDADVADCAGPVPEKIASSMCNDVSIQISFAFFSPLASRRNLHVKADHRNGYCDSKDNEEEAIEDDGGKMPLRLLVLGDRVHFLLFLVPLHDRDYLVDLRLVAARFVRSGRAWKTALFQVRRGTRMIRDGSSPVGQRVAVWTREQRHFYRARLFRLSALQRRVGLRRVHKERGRHDFEDEAVKPRGHLFVDAVKVTLGGERRDEETHGDLNEARHREFPDHRDDDGTVRNVLGED